jgi:hypothetical protein
MTICGYNKTMGSGIRHLFDGVYDAVKDKAIEEECRFQDVLIRELIEIPAINKSLSIDNTFQLKMFYGLNQLVFPFFEYLLKTFSEIDITRELFLNELERYISVLEEAEDKSLSVPYPDKSEKAIEKRALDLGQWIKENLGEN